MKKFPPNLPQNFQRIYGESANIVPLAFGDLRYDVLTRVPRFRLPAPLRGSTPRQWLIFGLAVAPLCRSAQNDTVGMMLCEI